MKNKSFRLNLSVGTEKVASKEDGKNKIEFKYQEDIPLNEDILKEIFTNFNQSTNIWDPCTSKKDNYSHTTGIMLDIDNSDSVPHIAGRDFIDKFHKYHFLLYPSTNHLVKTDQNNIPTEKFRVIFPLDPQQYGNFNTIEKHGRLYSNVLSEFPWMDSSCAGPDRKFFPFCGSDDSWFLNINVGNDYYQPDLQPQKFNFKIVKKVPRLSLPMEIKKDIGNIDSLNNIVEDLKNKKQSKASLFCPFCDPKDRGNPNNHNAAVFIDNEGVPSLFCSSCQSRNKGESGSGNYYLDLDEAYTIQSKGLNIAVFRDIITDQYYLGDKSRITGDYRIDKIAKQNIPNALISRKMVVPEIIDEVEFLHDFTKDSVLDIENGFVNRYIPTPYIKMTSDPSENYKLPATIEKLTRHICGESDEIFNSLIRHLAYSIQNRQKILVAFLFQGVQGTGKGLWFNNVLAPIFGRNYCTETLHRVFLKEFNSMLESNIWILVDEIEANFNNKGNELVRVLKQAITDTHISIEEKGKDIRNGKNNAGFFFATNKRNGILLEEGDRRFNIGDWQDEKVNETSWWPSDKNIIKSLSSELKAFTLHLKSLSINHAIVNRVVKNDARKAIIDISQTNTDLFFKAFKERDWSWMIDNISEKEWLGKSVDECKYIIQYLHTADKISRKKLQKIYFVITHIEKTPTGFTQLCKRYGIKVGKMRFDKKCEQGIRVK